MFRQMEIWKDIQGYEKLYQISNLGRVKSLPKKADMPYGGIRISKEKILKPYLSGRNYFTVTLCKNKNKIKKYNHRLVAETFIPNPKNKPEVNHKDGIKSHYYESNLEWVTSKENNKHALENKLRIPIGMKGINHPKCKLTESQVYRIKWIAKYCHPQKGFWKKLAKSLNINPRTITAITSNVNWKFIQVN